MTPQPSTIAHYRITAKLGEGGMGAVYRATDTKLNRDVAIKVLPDTFAADPDRLARFTREAQVLASLNHPNIAAIYGVEDRALVLELVDGSEPKGPLTAEEALPLVHQLADALEYAHERGIVHRDLKPANLRLTPEGNLKVLDFGLAKALSTDSAATSTSTANSPTLTMRATMAGMIMGTAAYMAPEQARGQQVDKRADIWAFGAVVYELLTGKQLFAADTTSDILAAVLTREPDLSAVPTRFRKLLRLCLTRDPRQRLRDISAARLLLDEPEPIAPATAAKASRAPWLIAGAALVLAAATTAILLTRPKPAEPLAARFELPMPEGAALPNQSAATQWAPSPDGRHLAITATQNEHTAIWLRPIGSRSAHRLDKTDDASFPFWSPDGQFIGFFADGKLKKIQVGAGLVQTICDLPRDNSSGKPGGNGATWNRDGLIVFASSGALPLYRVAASGGDPTAMTRLNSSDNERSHLWPQFLPDGRHVLYLADCADPEKDSIYVQELGSDQRILVMRSFTRVAWAAPGYLLFGRESSLFAQPLDPATFHLKGEPVLIEDDVTINQTTHRSTFAASDNGVLVYRTGSTSEGEVIWYDRAGKRVGTVGKKDLYHSVNLSPDGRKAAVVKGPPSNLDVWIVDLQTGAWTRGINDGKIMNWRGVWSRDSRLVYVNRGSGQNGILEIEPATGKVRELTKEPYQVQDLSPDGASLLVSGSIYRELGTIPVTGDSRIQTLNKTDYGRNFYHLSPDGKWLAYSNLETGAAQVMVVSYPSFSEKRQISVDGGSQPRWRADGQELFFVRNGALMSSQIRAGVHLESSVPKELFRFHGATAYVSYSPSADGSRFLFLDLSEDTLANRSITVMLNWTAELKKP